ncbi:MAG: 16S rRNA (cytidine(1402)-2'-O)-methyltransferase [Egibacteraceae bacterium]
MTCGCGPIGPEGKIVLVATPIGNLGDLSPRAVRALGEADVVAAEDTRRSRILLDHARIRVPLVSYHDHNEQTRTGWLLDRVEAGQTVAVVTDAGTPGVADPGFTLVQAAIARGLRVEAVPGPTAVVHALVLSGLPMDRFVFEGFLPRKPGARARRLAELAGEVRTLVFYAAPHRVAADLQALCEILGDRPAALCRELTKLHEEVWRDSLPALAARAAAEGLRGEVTLVVGRAPSTPPGPVTDAQLRDRVRALLATGLDRKTALRQVADAAGVPKRQVYDALTHLA